MASDDFKDPERGYRAYVDEDDLINWYVGAEITGNIDALYSIYMYKDEGEEKMHFGPLWDLDLGYDNSSERSLLRALEAYLGLWNRPFENILQRMWQDPWFAHACNQRLQQLVDAGLQTYMTDHIDSLRTAIWRTEIHIPYLQQAFAERDATGIRDIREGVDGENGYWFDLYGRRIEKPTRRGIYIHNDKKVIRR